MLSHPKDPVPDLQRRDVVYKIPCAACSSSYIGQTGRKLSHRLDEHRHAVRQADFNSSALAEHAWTCDHAVDWSNVKVLPCLHSFWHAIPTSFYIFNVFYFLVSILF